MQQQGTDDKSDKWRKGGGVNGEVSSTTPSLLLNNQACPEIPSIVIRDIDAPSMTSSQNLSKLPSMEDLRLELKFKVSDYFHYY